MLDKIKKYAEKGFYIGLYPILEKSGYQWVSYVMIGKDRKWMEGDKGCTMSAFWSPEDALNAALKFCEKRD